MIAVLVCAAALAAEPPAEESKAEDQAQEAIELPDITVSTSRRELPAVEAPRSVDSVTEERRTELQARSMPEALDETPGVFVQRTNRGSGSPIIRGLVGPQNLIVVDGVRFNTSTFRTGPNQYLALIDPTAMIRVEAVRGPSSVLYGNGAMGGVFHVLADEPQLSGDVPLWAGEVAGHFGSADLGGGGSVWASGSYKDFGVLIGGHYNHFGGLRTGSDFEGSSEVPLSAYDAGYWRAKLIYDPGSWAVTASYFGTLIRDAGRTDALGLGEARQYDNDDHLAYARFEARGKDIFRRFQATLSYHRLDERVDRFNCQTRSLSTGGGTTDVVADIDRCSALDDSVIEKKRLNLDTVDTIGGDLELQLAAWDDRLQLTTGLDLYYDQVGSSREDAKAADGFVFVPKSRGNFSDGSTYLTLGAFAHVDAAVVKATNGLELRVSGGIRYSHFEAQAPNVPGLGDVDYDFDGAMGSVGIQLVVPERLNLYLTALQGFRAPNLQETTLLGDTGTHFEVPNADLEPETSHTIEVGSKVNWGPVSVNAAYYYTQLQNVIDRASTRWEGAATVDGKEVVQRVNSSRGVTHGVEGSVAVRFWRMTLSSSVAWTQSEITDASGVTVPARRVPPVFGTAALRYDHPGRLFYVELSSRWAGPQDRLNPGDESDHRICQTSPYSGVLHKDVGSACPGGSAWGTLSIRGGYRILPELRADVALTNLTDANYRVYGSGYDAAGFDARATVTASF